MRSSQWWLASWMGGSHLKTKIILDWGDVYVVSRCWMWGSMALKWFYYTNFFFMISFHISGYILSTSPFSSPTRYHQRGTYRFWCVFCWLFWLNEFFSRKTHGFPRCSLWTQSNKKGLSGPSYYGLHGCILVGGTRRCDGGVYTRYFPLVL